ncbi:MAG: 50S ribosomal protein L23 [Candidatus Pacebacteria bacterium]|nr:50S ribosomal protein L23 [Candidatus Paceibacterota bacterium]
MATKKTTIEKKDDVKAVAKLITAPRITEKASMQSSANAYTFVVAKNATKHTILAEFKKEYKVTPKAINITNMPRRNTFIRGKHGTQAGIKKAIVFLKKGDTITLS